MKHDYAVNKSDLEIRPRSLMIKEEMPLQEQSKKGEASAVAN